MCFQVGAGDSVSSVVLLEQFSFLVSRRASYQGLAPAHKTLFGFLCDGASPHVSFLGMSTDLTLNLWACTCCMTSFVALHVRSNTNNSRVASTAEVVVTMLAATEKVRCDESWAGYKNHGLSVYGDWVCHGCLRCLKRWQQIEVGFAASSHITFRVFLSM